MEDVFNLLKVEKSGFERENDDFSDENDFESLYIDNETFFKLMNDKIKRLNDFWK